MKIKFLSYLVGCLLLFTVASCISNSDNVEYSSSTIIQAFAIDSVNHVYYTFSIDQVNGRIFNRDSLPVGADTIIDKIKITTLTSLGTVTIRNKANTADSVLVANDSVNLTGTMKKPYMIKVFADDGVNYKQYSLEVRVHQQQPDSLNWGKGPVGTNVFSYSGRTRSVVFNNNLYIFSENVPWEVHYTNTVSPGTWVTGEANVPSSFKATSVVAYNGKLYGVTNEGVVYESSDALNWVKNEALSTQAVEMLLTSFPKGSAATNVNELTGIAAIVRTTSGNYFACTNEAASAWKQVGDVVPTDFPTNHLVATVFTNNTGAQSAMLTGNKSVKTASDTISAVWATQDGLSWSDLATESTAAAPFLEEPSIIYYGGYFYLCGKNFNMIYKSTTGLEWYLVKSKFMFPLDIRGISSDYSLTIDSNNYIWLVRNEPNSVWRGRENRLGFDVQ